MILGKLDQLTTQAGLGTHPVWREAFAWIEQHAANRPPGIYELRQKRMYVNLHGYATKPRADCRYECHDVYVDLQYCIAGGEIIEWHPRADLVAKDAYDAAKDVVHFHPPDRPAAVIRMTPDSAAIFYPNDGHMPKIADGINQAVTKVVIKLDVGLLL
ncbi:MAG: YhcH/YjgK/YiaL family protein [Opitutaceae bacterium]|nr:YhcH/YjgK/YiaL family protein [Opitutaceae bacterium]